jgi:hypothetical protein
MTVTLLQRSKLSIRAKNVQLLDGIVEELGFSRSVEFDDISCVNYFLRKHEVEADKEANLNGHSLLSRSYDDQTDYISPYKHGFIRKDVHGNVAGYGIITSIKGRRNVQLERPHHFFFIDKFDKDEEQGIDGLTGAEFAQFLGRQACCSPGNPGTINSNVPSFLSSFALPALAAYMIVAISAYAISGIDITLQEFVGERVDPEKIVGGVAALITGIESCHVANSPKLKGSYAKSSLFPFETTYGLRAIKSYTDQYSPVSQPATVYSPSSSPTSSTIQPSAATSAKRTIN